MMGDLVLTEAEINPVMTKLLSEGLQVTAVHNHLLRATPPTFYMHVSGKGDAEQLARMTRVALEESQTPWEMGAASAPAATDLGIDTAKIDEAIGFKGRNNNGVYQFGVPRSDVIQQDGMAVPGGIPAPWVRRSQSIFSRPAAARRQLRGTSWRSPTK